MNVEQLVSMANQIGRFYQAYPNHDEVLASTARHIRRSWDPRMRSALLHHVDTEAGEGLDPLVLEAVRAHRADLAPAEKSPRP